MKCCNPISDLGALSQVGSKMAHDTNHNDNNFYFILSFDISYGLLKWNKLA